MPTKTTDSSPNIDVTSPYTPRRPTPIVSISMNNPLGTMLRKIKNFLTHKQTLFATSFTIKVTPIVALVSLLGVTALFGGGITTAYNFGKTVEQKFLATNPSASSGQAPSPTPAQQIINNVSKAGTIKATYQNPPTPTIIPSIAEGSHSASQQPTPSPTPTQTVLHYILVSRSGSINYLASSTINLQSYLNLRVLITGSFNNTSNTLTVTKATDIEILP